jgi:pentapeptide MXKDX repeat protein
MIRIATSALTVCLALAGANALAEDAMGKPGTGMEKDATGMEKKDAMGMKKKDSMAKKKPMKKDSMAKDGMGKDSMGKDSMGK